MSMTVIAIVIVALLLAGITISSVIQQREQAAAERRHRAAHFRAGVRDGQEMLELGSILPFDVSVRDVLLDYISANVQNMRDLDRDNPGIAEGVAYINAQRQKPPTTDSALQLPTHTEQLTALRTHLHRVTEFVARLRADPRISTDKATQAFQYLARLRLRCDVEGHFKLAQMALLNKQTNLAHQYITYARERLMQENISDSYVQEQLAVLEQISNELRAAIEAADPTQVPQAEKAVENPEVDSLFGEKKKW